MSHDKIITAPMTIRPADTLMHCMNRGMPQLRSDARVAFCTAMLFGDSVKLILLAINIKIVIDLMPAVVMCTVYCVRVLCTCAVYVFRPHSFVGEIIPRVKIMGAC